MWIGVLYVSTVFITAVVISWREVYGKQMLSTALVGVSDDSLGTTASIPLVVRSHCDGLVDSLEDIRLYEFALA